MAQRTVLLVDPDVTLAERIGVGLLRHSLEVKHIQSALDVLSVHESPGLIVLCIDDVQPTGWTLCTKIKRNSTLKGAPLIITSSRANEADFLRQQIFNLRTDAFLKKPFTIDALLAKVGPVLDALPPAPPPDPARRKPLRTPESIDASDLLVIDDEPQGAVSGSVDMGSDEMPIELTSVKKPGVVPGKIEIDLDYSAEVSSGGRPPEQPKPAPPKPPPPSSRNDDTMGVVPTAIVSEKSTMATAIPRSAAASSQSGRRASSATLPLPTLQLIDAPLTPAAVPKVETPPPVVASPVVVPRSITPVSVAPPPASRPHTPAFVPAVTLVTPAAAAPVAPVKAAASSAVTPPPAVVAAPAPLPVAAATPAPAPPPAAAPAPAPAAPSSPVVPPAARTEASSMKSDGTAEVSRLTAENERLLRELDEAQKARPRTSTGSAPTRELLQLREQLNSKDKELLDHLENLEARERDIFELRKTQRELERAKSDLNEKLLNVEKDLVEQVERNEWLSSSFEASQKEVADWKARYEADFDEAKKMIAGALDEERLKGKKIEESTNERYEKTIERLSQEHTQLLRETKVAKDAEIARLTTSVGDLERQTAALKHDLEGSRTQLSERTRAGQELDEKLRATSDKAQKLEGSLLSTRKALATILAVLERTTDSPSPPPVPGSDDKSRPR